MIESVGAPPVDYRAMMDHVERVLEQVHVDREERPTVQQLADAVVRELGRELGISGGRLYLREGEAYRLWATFGKALPVEPGIVVSETYGPLQQVFARGTVYATADDPSLDRDLEDKLGAGAFAAIEVGDREYLLAFDLNPEHGRDQVLFALALLRQSISQRIRRERMEDALRQARRIQASILPREMPRFGDYDVAAKSFALETVGGDFFDLIPITDKILGVAIADVSGHGLPAALQVRDIYMGLRMGTARDFKIVRTVERLNQIIHLSTMTSRFVSMFYGELEIDGTFIFVNAGHPPPFHMDAEGNVRFLEKGGVVLGPLPEATYTRGYLTMGLGDVVVLFTDGLLETSRVPHRGASASEEYGVERLVAVVEEVRETSAAAIVEAILGDVAAFSQGSQPSDDRTVVVIKRPLVEPG